MAKKVVEKKRKRIPTMTVGVDTVSKLLQSSSKPKKARRMSRMVTDATSRNQMLEIAKPVKD